MAYDANITRLPRIRHGRRAALVEVIEMRQLCYTTARMLGNDLAGATDTADRSRLAGAIASLTKGWESMQDQLRILKGKPMPGSLRPESTKSKKGKVHSFPTETAE